MKKVSIIVPVYNAEKYLDDCLKSIITQTYKNLEIILINDGSTDNSLKVCYKYKEIDERIVVVNNKNHGVSYSRNCGIKIATGNYIVFIDSDDIIDIRYIEKLIEPTKKEDYDLIICGLTHKFREKEKWISKKEIIPNLDKLTGNIKLDYRFLVHYYLEVPFVKLFKKSIIDKNNITFPENLLISEDQVFNREYIKHVKKYTYIDEYLYMYYHRNNNSLSMRKENIYWESDLENVLLMKKFFSEEKIFEGEYILLGYSIWIVYKYLSLNRHFIKEYSIFKDRVYKIRKIIQFDYEKITWRKSLFLKCLKNKYVLPIYIYFCLKKLLFILRN